MKLGMLFGEPDPWAILEGWPPGLFEHWKALYLMEPWDAANGKALAEAKYKPPPGLFPTGRYLSHR